MKHSFISISNPDSPKTRTKHRPELYSPYKVNRKQGFIGLQVEYTGVEAKPFNVLLLGMTKPPPPHARVPYVGPTSMTLVPRRNWPKTLHFISATSPAFHGTGSEKANM